MKLSLFLSFLLLFALVGCNAPASQSDSLNPNKISSPNNQDSRLVGKWRSYSDIKNTRVLEIRQDGRWELGSSSGTWKTEPIKPEDWGRWGMSEYGPISKIILYGWNKGMADGPIEESASRVDFFWVIYNVTLETIGEPAQVQIKYGHSNWD